jgi:hypothetical protein
MHRFKPLPLALLLLTPLVAISDVTSPVVMEYSSSAITITNRSDQIVCYAIHESELLKRIEWGPVCSADRLIKPKSMARVLVDVKNFKPSGQAVVSWWYKDKVVVEGQARFELRK